MKHFLFSLIFLSVSFSYAKPTFTSDQVKEKAKEYDMLCNEFDDKNETHEVEQFTVEYLPYEGAEKKTVDQYSIATCMVGAYNSVSVLFLSSSEGLQAIPLAIPLLNSKLKVVGFSADVVGGALTFDPRTQTLSSFTKGRGIGDVSNVGTYGFQRGQVVLRKYLIDATLNEKIDPKVVYENKELLD